MARISTDHGRTADRVASLDPLEVHRAICEAAIDALREGAPLERLDGLEYFHLRHSGFGVKNTKVQKVELLKSQVARQQQIARQARANANATTSPELRSEFIEDAEAAHSELVSLQEQLELLESACPTDVLPTHFEAEVDFIAHALAQLAKITTTPNGEFGEAINQVVTDLRFTPVEDRRCEVEFYLLLPADGMVLRFGPIRTTVRNRAYPKTLSRDADGDAPRPAFVHLAAGHDERYAKAPSLNEALQLLKADLVSAGFTPLAAGTLARSDSAPLYSVCAHELWNEPLSDGLDPAYVAHVLDVYRAENFEWNPRHHSLDCEQRQALVDALLESGGEASQLDLIAAFEGTPVTSQKIADFSRPQTVGNAPTWNPPVERRGDWRQQSPRGGRRLRVLSCPHCGGLATKVLRMPEVPDNVLCPACRRMPSASSPVFPEDYLH